MSRMSRRQASSPTSVSALLTAVLPSLADGLLALAIRRDWATLVGPETSRRAQPGDLRAGTLTVIVDNSPWLQELTLRQGELLSRLQARYGAEAIRALHFALGVPTEGGSPARAAEATNHERARGGEWLTAEEEAWVAGATSSVGDPALAETVRRVLVKDTLSRRRGKTRK